METEKTIFFEEDCLVTCGNSSFIRNDNTVWNYVIAMKLSLLLVDDYKSWRFLKLL
jgi:hypothetical protein